MQTLKEEYDRMSDTKILEQAQLLGSGSFLRAVESMIIGEKVTAAYAVQTTRDELESTFSSPVSYTHLDVYKRQSFSS